MQMHEHEGLGIKFLCLGACCLDQRSWTATVIHSYLTSISCCQPASKLAGMQSPLLCAFAMISGEPAQRHPALSMLGLCRVDAWVRSIFPSSFPAQGYVFDYRPDLQTEAWVPFVGQGAAVRCGTPGFAGTNCEAEPARPMSGI